MNNTFPLQLIPLLPLVGAVINLLFGKRLGKAAGTIGCTVVAIAAIFGWWGAYLVFTGGEEATLHAKFFEADWIKATDGAASIHIGAGLVLDRLSTVMVLTITNIGFLIHLYSTAYMEHDEGYSRYFGYLNLFTGAMLILVLGDSLPVTFVGWEGVGLCSYLLIGFWYTKDQNAYAGRKAFIVNRVGDFGFLLGMFLIFGACSTLNYAEIGDKRELLRAAFLPGVLPYATYATFAGLLLFVGATGKSAQLPLYVWLPDAMAGPTPVSALIHAATMVTAGVYMVARLHFVFEMDAFVLAVIASVGAITALFAATMGITARPIKKILAYSTVSQLGFMFIGVGTATYGAGVFHLVTHACFKAGLFLGAGSIMHALSNEEDVMKMGGLAKKLPITRWTFLVYCLAIAGIFPFAGFFSKDAILAGAFDFTSTVRAFDHPPPVWPLWLGHVIYGVGLCAAACTAFYMFRAYFLVFHGKFRGDPHVYDHAHESPWPMATALVVLAALSIFVGFLGIPEAFHKDWNFFDQWLRPIFARAEAPGGGAEEHIAGGALEWTLMIVATLVSAGGIALAWVFYGRGLSPAADRAQASAGGVYTVLVNKYYVDEIYDRGVVSPLRKLAFFLWKVIDTFVIDLVMVRGPAILIDLFGRSVRYLQNGDVQRAIVGVVAGAAAILAVGVNWTAWRASALTTRVNADEVVVEARGAPPGSGTQLEYTFDFGDDTKPVPQTGRVATHHYAQPGKKKVSVEVRDPRWGATSRSSETVTIKAGSPSARNGATP